jgi:hypothetical protein
MAGLKTKQTNANVEGFLNSVSDEQRSKDAKVVCAMMQEITGDPPKMWGTAIIGFGLYHYKYQSGRQGDWMVVGLSPRKIALTIYLMTGFEDEFYKQALAKLGKHTVSKGCLYIRKLSDVDQKVLRQIIEKSVKTIKSGKLKFIV